MESLNDLLFKIETRDVTISLILVGFINMEVPPATSGRDELLEVITGTPQAIASSGGKPKPSKNDG